MELPLRRIFETPTIAELAVAIVETQGDPGQAPDGMVRKIRRRNVQLLATLDQLSEDEVASLLAEMLAEEEGRE